jgi:hypothetical protein
MSETGRVTVSIDQGRRIVTQQISGEPNPFFVSHDYPDALTHHYAPAEMNQDVMLFTGSFRSEPSEPAYYGDVRWRWGPVPRIVARGQRETRPKDITALLDEPAPNMWVDPAQLIVELPGGRLPPQPSSPAQTAEAAGLDVQFNVEQELGNESMLDRCTFLIPNGWQALDSKGVCQPDRLEKTWFGRTSSQGDGWAVVLDLHQSMMDDDQWSTLKHSFGQRFTHVGEIRRLDDSTFTGRDAFDALDRIRVGLNLALGRRTTAALPVGWYQGDPVWCRWRRAPVDPHRSKTHWLDQTIAADQISTLLNLTLDYTSDALAKSVIKGAMAYYVASNNDVTVELTTALPVSGLQLLAYYRFVSGPNACYSNTKWKPKSTEEQIRLLLDDAGIDTGIPSHMSNILVARTRLSAAKQSGDALTTAIEMRNVATHPTKQMPYEAFNVYEWAEIGMIARYWLCLCILKTIGYNGSIADALGPTPPWTGSIKNPPWVKASGAPQPSSNAQHRNHRPASSRRT